MLEPVEDQYTVIGHIVRSHGVKGEVVLRPTLETPELFDRLQLVHIESTRGELVPARIESVRIQQKGNRLSFFVKFEHISDRDDAAVIKDSAVYAERRDMPEEVFAGEPIQADYREYRICDESGTQLGSVTGTIDSPAHLILEVETTEGDQLLIPFVEEYIHGVNEQAETITCHRLDQLTED